MHGQVKTSSMREKLDQNREGHGTWPDMLVPHLREHAQAELEIASLHAAFEKRVVHNLVTLEMASLEFFLKPHGLWQVTAAAISFDQSAERNQIRLHICGSHFLKNLGRTLQVAGTDAGIDQAVEDNHIARYLLRAHLSIQVHCRRWILCLREALDKSGIENRIPVEAPLLHDLKSLQRLVQVTTLDTSIEHTSVGHRVGFQTFPMHLGPSLHYSVDVACMSVRLHDGPIGHSGALDSVTLHQGQRLLEARHVAELAEDV
mmetsp:Transcript_37418/g.87821  ORF Transcript_37418/g.87821 Transcript_37418/m.87821 type:complete len:260 (-) Transcript_37418:783-1562(-)